MQDAEWTTDEMASPEAVNYNQISVPWSTGTCNDATGVFQLPSHDSSLKRALFAQHAGPNEDCSGCCLRVDGDFEMMTVRWRHVASMVIVAMLINSSNNHKTPTTAVTR